MRKHLLIISVLFIFERICFADTFTDLLQDLAMQTACLGTYSNTEAGKYGIRDPHDYYSPPMLAERFAKMSGDRTRIQTFYGICFDYAQAAWDNIKQYQSNYNKVGMLNQQWYIVAIKDNPNIITLYDPIPESRIQQVGSYYTDKRDGVVLERWNGVYCKKNSEYKIKTHSGATWHAWLWIQRTDNTWYWIDPTWTDNTGYVWWGYVSNTEEIQLAPSAKYCITCPPYLPDYIPKQTQINPVPQEKKKQEQIQPEQKKQEPEIEIEPKKKEEKKTTPTTTQTENYDPCGIGCAIDLIGACCSGDIGLYYCVGYTGSLPYEKLGNPEGTQYFNLDKFGIQLSFADNNQVKWFGILTIDYLINHSEKLKSDSMLFGYDLGIKLMEYIQPYTGISLGLKWYDSFLGDSTFAWKICGGFRFAFPLFCINTDISYGSILGVATTVSIGIFK